MIGEPVAGRRRQEAQADGFAIDVLGNLLHPAPPRRLRFEIGTAFLMNGELGKLVTVLIALNPHGAALMARAGLSVTPAAVRALSERLGREDGLIETVFPNSHPALVDRLLEMMTTFSRNPMSAFYNNPTYGQEQEVWRLLIQLLCRGIGSGQ
jgi:hypothetical protein